MRWWQFLKYNNAVPIVISLILLSFGTTLAASPEIRSEVAGSVVSSQSKVISVDNTYIANKDLSSYTPQVQIGGVTEDPDMYYVEYSLHTIDLKDSVWQDVVRDEVMKVRKDALEGRDLGLYVTRELKQRVDHEIALLKETQHFERAQVTQKTVATEYSGLVGKFIDDTTVTLPGYVPVIPEETSGASSQTSAQASPSGTPSGSNGGASSNGSGDRTPPVIQILGRNPAQLALHDSYADLGVVVTDNSGIEFGHTTYVDGTLVSEVTLDTSHAGTYTIRYSATDAGGNTAQATRTVIVGNGIVPGSQASSSPVI